MEEEKTILFSKKLIDQRADAVGVDDDCSQDSEMTLLSARSYCDDEDDDSGQEDDEMHRNATDMDLLVQSLAVRDKILERIHRNNLNSPAYMQLLRENEALVRTQLLLKSTISARQHQQPDKNKEDDDDGEDEDEKEERGNKNKEQGKEGEEETRSKKMKEASSESGNGWMTMMTKSLYQTCLFEVHNSVPGVLLVLAYCVAHLSAYEALSGAIAECTRNVNNQSVVYFSLGLFGILSMRCSGGLWAWLDDNRYAAVKFHLHNRIRLKSLDAKIQRWFKQHNALNVFVNFLGIYLCLIAVSYFQHQLMKGLDCRNQLLANLPSKEYDGVITRVQEKLDPVSAYQAYYNNSNSSNNNCNETCELTETLAEADEVYLYSQVTVSSYYSLMGFAETETLRPTTMILFFVVCVSASLLSQSWLGYRLL